MKHKSESSLEDACVTQAGNAASPLLPPSPFAACPPVLLQPVIHAQDSDLQSRSRICLLPASSPTTPAITPLLLTCAGRTPHWPPCPCSCPAPSTPHCPGNFQTCLWSHRRALNMWSRWLSTAHEAQRNPCLSLPTHPHLPPHPPVTGRHTSSSAFLLWELPWPALPSPTPGCEDASPPQKRLP